jgi:hypothetical protein
VIKINLAIALFLVFKISFAQEGTPTSTWISSPVKIDGKATEWKLPLRFYDDGTKLFFAFANDDKNLYLCFQSPDDMFQMKIIRAGMEVSVSAKGKHKVSITFPITQQSVPEPTKGDNNEMQNAEKQNRRTNFILQNTMMNVKGFVTRNGIIPINDTSGIHAAINWDENNKLTYEIAIPFKEWFGADYNTADIVKDISMDVTINALKQTHHNNGGGENGMAGGRGRMSGGGGGMRHQRSADSDAESQVMPGEYKYSLYEKSKLKQKFILAQSSDTK